MERSIDARTFLTYALVPAWTIAGALDWYFHRKTKIQDNAGAVESLLHLVMGAEAGTAMVAAAVCEHNAGTMAIATLMLLVHEATAMVDVAYATTRRTIPQGESHTHSFLEVLPYVTAAVTVCSAPSQARAVAGIGSESPRFELRVHRPAPSPRQLATIAIGASIGMGLHLEEFIRCLRAQRAG